jgi:hypothetical protein
VAILLMLVRNGNGGFIDWLELSCTTFFGGKATGAATESAEVWASVYISRCMG